MLKAGRFDGQARFWPSRAGGVGLAVACAAVLAAAAPDVGGARPAQPRRPAPAAVAAKLTAYPTPYYIIHTDLDKDSIREAVVRMTCMAREYQKRTAGFGRQVRTRLPFYLFSRAEDYYAAGGMPGSAGVYMGNKLMARADKKMGENVWRVIQHEGFHQYVHQVLSHRVPVWVNEGMAEYFGEGIWTGDSFVTGAVPPWRLKQLKGAIKGGRMLPFLEMLEMSYDQWQTNFASRNYLQAWAMVHFLAHADDGKYQEALNGFLNDIARGGVSWKTSFLRRFGRDVDGFQKRFSEWWTSQPDNPTADLYAEAAVRTLMSFFGRAFGQGQRFADIDEFFKAAREDSLKEDPKLFLPKDLLAQTMKRAPGYGRWELLNPKGIPRIQLTTPAGTVLTGSFNVRPGASVTVNVETKKGAPRAEKVTGGGEAPGGG